MKSFSPNFPLLMLAGVGAYMLVRPKDAYAGTSAVQPYEDVVIPDIYVKARPMGLLVLAQTIYGEARGEGYTGMQAVANVVMNRYALAQKGLVTWWGRDIEGICLCYRAGYYQFSAWNPRDPNRQAMINATPEIPAFAAALEIAGRALDGELPDITNKATHYFAKTGNPYWAQGKTASAVIGNHIFMVA